VSSSNSSSISTVSGLTRGSGEPASTTRTAVTAGPGRGTRAFQVNLTPDVTLHQLLPTGVKLHDLIGSDPPPNMDSGIPICLSYHCTAGCWSNCGRAASHGKALSAQEKTRLVSYIQAQTEKIQARPTGTATVPSAGG
jgi:hypothetical protein